MRLLQFISHLMYCHVKKRLCFEKVDIPCKTQALRTSSSSSAFDVMTVLNPQAGGC